MRDRLRRFFAAPVFQDEETTRVAGLINSMVWVILLIAIGASIALAVSGGPDFWGNPNNLFIIGSMCILALAMRVLLQRGHLRAISLGLCLALFAVITFSLCVFGGIDNPVTSGYLMCVVIAGMLLGGRAALAFMLLGLAAMLALWGAERAGYVLPLPTSDPTFNLVAHSGILSMSGLLLRHAAHSLANALQRARHNEHAQREANLELEALRASLEQQVVERTRETKRRSAYLEASAEVSRTVTSILETEPLIRQVVELIRERFELYHVALFTLDRSRRWAEFRAGTGEVGRVLLEQKFRLEVGGHSMVGWCTSNGQVRVAQDVRAEAQRVSHPLLSKTRSEAALPLVARGQIIGALSAQSDRLDAFDQDAVAALQTMADQVAVALDNARLFAETQAALEAERRAYGEASRQGWGELLQAMQVPGYVYAGRQLSPAEAIQSPELRAIGRAGPLVSVPIKVRGQVIGLVDLQKGSSDDTWTAEEIALLEALVEQLGVALDSARLYQTTQRRAARERLVGEVTARLRETLDIQSVLQTAAREFGQTLQAVKVDVRLTPQEAPPATQETSHG